MDLLRCKLTMLKLKELNLQDLHLQIMYYVEYDKIRKLFKYCMTQLLHCTNNMRPHQMNHILDQSSLSICALPLTKGCF